MRVANNRPFWIPLALLLALASCDARRGEQEIVRTLPLSEGTRFTLAPTFFGLSQEKNEERVGFTDVVLEDFRFPDVATLSWTRRIARVAEGEEEPVGVREKRERKTEIVQIEGRISTKGLAASHEITPPFYWKEGSEIAETSLIWLGQEAFRELRSTRKISWNIDFLGHTPAWFAGKVQELRGKGVDRYELLAGPEFGTHTLNVEGKRSAFQVIDARDSFGNTFVILDDERNPLILKLTYNPVSAGALDVFGLGAFVKGVAGYEVADIRPAR